MLMPKQNNSILGVDIGSRLIKIVQVTQNETSGEKIKLLKWGCIEASDIDDESGGNRQSESYLAQAIKDCYKQYGFSTKKVSLCLSDSSIIFRDIGLPEMKDDEIKENIKYEMAEYFSIDPDKYAIAYRILKRDGNEGRTVLRVLGVAAPLDLVARYVRILKKAGLKPEYVDINVNAYLKAAKLLSEIGDISSSRGVCIMDYGYSTLTISVFEGGAPFVTRTVDKSWEAENFDAVAAALNQVLDYYYSRNYTSRIEKVWVVGGGGFIKDMCQYLSSQTGTDVRRVTPQMLKIEYDNSQDFPVGIYFKSIGTAIREG